MAVAFGDGRDKCCVFLTIDLTSVGNWAERNNVSYASYQELAAHNREQMDVTREAKGAVSRINAALAGEQK